MTGKPCSGKSYFAAQLAKHYDVPHIHKEQVLFDIQNWNKEKEAEYNHRQAEKARLQKLADERAAEKARLEQIAREEEAARLEEEKRKRREALGSDAEEDDENKDEDGKDVTSAMNETGKIGSEGGAEGEAALEGEGGEDAPKDDRQAVYERQLAQLAAEEAESDDEFVTLDLKLKINKFYADNPNEKKIPSEMISEAFRWRLSQNDCQNRGYILDGYPTCYTTCNPVFFITPEKPAPKAKKVDEEGNEEEENAEEEADPEELAKKYAPKFQQHIYPDSVILMRGKDEYIRKRAANLKAEDNKKWDPENLERRLQCYRENNDVSLFQTANNDPMLGHPKAQKHLLPLTRFFQENKTEVFEIECDGNTFEMFESMRVYIERNGRSYNYLPSVKVLNVKREQELIKEEQNANADVASSKKQEEDKVELERAELESY